MTRIDFHILQGSEVQQLLAYTCRLTEKATNQGHQVTIYTEGPEASEALDKQLWCFRPESFVPHTLSEQHAAQCPVYITHSAPAGKAQQDVLIAAHSGPPPHFFSQFQRTIEIVLQQPARLKQSRENYSFYKSQGYKILSHKINI